MNKEKYCPRCKKELNIKRFSRSKNRYDGLQAYCIECMKLYRIEHYQANRQQYYDRNLRTNQKIRQIVIDIKNNNSCKDCGIKYLNEPWLFEFDHLKEEGKVSEISRLEKSGSIKKLLNEIMKCDLLCLICHRRRSASRGSWLENRFTGV